MACLPIGLDVFMGRSPLLIPGDTDNRSSFLTSREVQQYFSELGLP